MKDEMSNYRARQVESKFFFKMTLFNFQSLEELQRNETRHWNEKE